MPVRLIQAVAISTTYAHSLDLNATTVELECFTNAAGLTVRDAIVVALQVFLDFILIVAVAGATDATFSQDLQALGIAEAKLLEMQELILEGENTDLHLVDIIQVWRRLGGFFWLLSTHLCLLVSDRARPEHAADDSRPAAELDHPGVE